MNFKTGCVRLVEAALEQHRGRQLKLAAAGRRANRVNTGRLPPAGPAIAVID
jgi:hypothetical protein